MGLKAFEKISMVKVWEEVAIDIPQQWLICFTCLFYGNDMGSFSYGFDMVGNVPYQNHMKYIDGP